MKRKKYDSPTVQSVEFKQRLQLLSGSTQASLPDSQEAEGGEQDWN